MKLTTRAGRKVHAARSIAPAMLAGLGPGREGAGGSGPRRGGLVVSLLLCLVLAASSVEAAESVAEEPLADAAHRTTGWLAFRSTVAGWGLFIPMLDLGLAARTDEGLVAAVFSVGPAFSPPTPGITPDPGFVFDAGGVFAGALPRGPVDAFMGSRVSFAMWIHGWPQETVWTYPTAAVFWHLSLLEPGAGPRFRFALEIGVGLPWPVAPVVGLSFGAVW